MVVTLSAPLTIGSLGPRASDLLLKTISPLVLGELSFKLFRSAHCEMSNFSWAVLMCLDATSKYVSSAYFINLIVSISGFQI